MIFNLTQPLISSVPVLGKDFTWSGSDGTCLVIDDGGGNWRIKFLSSGVFTPLKDMTIDVFLVGGGGSSNNGIVNPVGGGGGGYTTTVRNIALTANTEYSIVVGAGGVISGLKGTDGGSSSAFGANAAGGKKATGSSNDAKGGNGGSGGGQNNTAGGTDGANGGGTRGGTGQGTTTREFGEADGTLYASGGDGQSATDAAADGAENTGDGGDGQHNGGSGIAIIRKHKEAAA